MFLAFSRDGGHLAYLAALRLQPVPLGTLNVVDTRKAATKKTLKEAPVVEFFWSPDGRTLAFVLPDTADGSSDVFVSQADGNTLPRLIAGGDEAF